jgi:hypothetical protein
MEAKRSSPRRLCQDFLLTCCFLEAFEDIQESLFPVGWQLDGLADGVHEPTQKDWVEVQDPSFTSLDSERGPEFVG